MYAGSINQSGVLEVTALAVGNSTVYGQILTTVCTRAGRNGKNQRSGYDSILVVDISRCQSPGHFKTFGAWTCTWIFKHQHIWPMQQYSISRYMCPFTFKHTLLLSYPAAVFPLHLFVKCCCHFFPSHPTFLLLFMPFYNNIQYFCSRYARQRHTVPPLKPWQITLRNTLCTLPSYRVHSRWL